MTSSFPHHFHRAQFEDFWKIWSFGPQIIPRRRWIGVSSRFECLPQTLAFSISRVLWLYWHIGPVDNQWSVGFKLIPVRLHPESEVHYWPPRAPGKWQNESHPKWSAPGWAMKKELVKCHPIVLVDSGSGVCLSWLISLFQINPLVNLASFQPSQHICASQIGFGVEKNLKEYHLT